MAITDATGLDCYLVETATVTTTKAECGTAIASGKRIGKIKTIGSIGNTKVVTEHKYLSNDPTQKAIGGASYGNVTIDCPYDAVDTAGQGELRTMFDGNLRKKLIIKETDGNYTVIPSVICTAVNKAYALDDFVMLSATVDIDAPYEDIIA